MSAKKQKILVPVDFSRSSRAALRFAADLAGRLGDQLVVLHVIHDPGEAPGYYARWVKKKKLRKIEDIAAEMMQAFLEKTRAESRPLKACRQLDTLLVRGLPVSRILEVVEQTQPYMVVMGSQGRTGLSHLLLGSKAEQVVQLCPVPVTIVKLPRDERDD